MNDSIITRREIEMIYKKSGANPSRETTYTSLNTGTLTNKLVSDFPKNRAIKSSFQLTQKKS